ncbi:MAG: NAD-dependent epimerase/dehydratase family protein [Elainella sp.]
MSDQPGRQFDNQKILITGGLGFIGSNLAKRLLQLGAEVVLVDNLLPNSGGNLYNIAAIQDQLTVHVLDMGDQAAMRPLIEDAAYLFNLAGQVSHQVGMQDPCLDLEINARSQLTILELCRHHNPTIKIVFTSTRHIYGRPDYLPVDEKHCLRPGDVNGVNKLAGESYHRIYHDAYGLRTAVLRLTSTYGSGMRIKDARQTFLGIWLRLLLEGKPFEVWGGEQLRDYSHVDDVVEALLAAAVSPAAEGQVFNLSGDRLLLKDLAQLLVDAHGSGEFSVRPFPTDRKSADLGDFYSDDQLIRSVLGWQPQVTLREGLARTLAYYQKHLVHYL